MELKRKKVPIAKGDAVEEIDKEKLDELADDSNVVVEQDDDARKKYHTFFKDIESIKFNEEYERLKGIVRLGDERLSKNKLMEVLDEICYDAKVAGYLYVLARRHFNSYEKLDYGIWYSGKIREAADSEELAKNASSEKIESWIVNKYPDEYKARTKKLYDLKMVRDALEIFYEQFNNRRSLIQTQNKIANN